VVIVVQKHVASKVCPTRCARTRTYCNAHALFFSVVGPVLSAASQQALSVGHVRSSLTAAVTSDWSVLNSSAIGI